MPSLKQNALSKSDVISSLTSKLKSTNPRILNFKDFDTNIPHTSWNYGINANGDKNNAVGLSLTTAKGSDVIFITVQNLYGKNTTGYEEIVKSAKSLGGKINLSKNGVDIYISTDKVDDVVKFIKDNLINITKQ